MGGLALSTVAAVVAGAGAAFANVAQPQTTPAPTVSQVSNPNGTVTVGVSGTWAWTTLKDETSARPCDHRFGVGWAMVWNDPKDRGFPLSYSSGSVTVRVAVGSEGSNPLNPDKSVSYDHTHPCGSFTLTNSPQPGDGTASGTWSGTHVYTDAASVPSSVCVVTYDLTGNPTGAPGPDPARLRFNNDDNSVRRALLDNGAWNSSPGGPNCVTLRLSRATPVLSSRATGAAVGSAISDTATLAGASGSSSRASGTITFRAYAPSDAKCAASPIYTGHENQ
jgi:hypothetical protein